MTHANLCVNDKLSPQDNQESNVINGNNQEYLQKSLSKEQKSNTNSDGEIKQTAIKNVSKVGDIEKLEEGHLPDIHRKHL